LAEDLSFSDEENVFENGDPKAIANMSLSSAFFAGISESSSNFL
jgi:hypothetical protein